MFGGMGNMGNMAGMMKKVQKVQAQMQKMQEELKKRTVEVSVVAGAVKTEMNGEKIVDADVSKFSTDGTVPPDGIKRPGLHNRSGRIHWCGHGEDIFWRNVRIREL